MLGAVLSVALVGSTVALAAILTGTQGNDTIRGSNQLDIINGLGGDDTIFPEGGPDSAYGHTGRDRLCQSASSDLLNGGEGDDEITDGTANLPSFVCQDATRFGATNDVDVLLGKAGNDFLNSADGDGLDVVDGGNGFDICHIDLTDLVRLGCESVAIVGS